MTLRELLDGIAPYFVGAVCFLVGLVILTAAAAAYYERRFMGDLPQPRRQPESVRRRASRHAAMKRRVRFK